MRNNLIFLLFFWCQTPWPPDWDCQRKLSRHFRAASATHRRHSRASQEIPCFEPIDYLYIQTDAFHYITYPDFLYYVKGRSHLHSEKGTQSKVHLYKNVLENQSDTKNLQGLYCGLASVWYKTTLNTGGVGGAGQTLKIRTSFLMSLALRIPILNNFQ